MQIKCEYCGSLIDDSLEKCPCCGATNNNMHRATDGTPKTIEELKQWYEARHLPSYETTRFFIGIDYKEPKAFGIYEENGEYIVYKNKADGTRAIRYRGTDEDYAVNELFLKLKSEILKQKENNVGKNSGRGNGKPPKSSMGGAFVFFGIIGSILLGTYYSMMGEKTLPTIIAFIGMVVIFYLLDKAASKNSSRLKTWLVYIPSAIIIGVVCFAMIKNATKVTYYSYNNNTYVEYQGDYLEYDGYDDYYPIDALPTEIETNPADYEVDWESSGWDESVNFESSDYYDDNYSSSSDSSDYDWGSSSDWDSGSSDWGSDW